MAQFTISISDKSSNVFLELMKNLKFVKKVERIDDYSISEEHKKIVRNRISKSDKNPELLLDWDEVKDNFILE